MLADPPTPVELAKLIERFASMPNKARLVFQRHRFDGDPLAGIASELGVDCRTVEKLLADAMFHLSDPKPSAANQMLTQPNSRAVLGPHEDQ